jgi:hypothetical protein
MAKKQFDQKCYEELYGVEGKKELTECFADAFAPIKEFVSEKLNLVFSKKKMATATAGMAKPTQEEIDEALERR